jgi:hypothetical protein
MLAGQLGFALDLANEYGRLFGASPVFKTMEQAAVEAVQRKCRMRRLIDAVKPLVPKGLMKVVKTVVGPQ